MLVAWRVLSFIGIITSHYKVPCRPISILAIDKAFERWSSDLKKWLFRVPALGIQAHSQMMTRVSNHLLSKVFRFKYHSQKVQGTYNPKPPKKTQEKHLRIHPGSISHVGSSLGASWYLSEKNSTPPAPCRVYLPTFRWFFMVNEIQLVGTYSIHGAFWAVQSKFQSFHPKFEWNRIPTEVLSCYSRELWIRYSRCLWGPWVRRVGWFGDFLETPNWEKTRNFPFPTLDDAIW